MAIILYLIAKEPYADREKLECYVIILDKMVHEDTRQNLFHWRRNNKGLVSGFWKIFERMVDKKLLEENGSAQFFILTDAVRIIQELPIILSDLLPYLDKVLSYYNNYAIRELLKKI